MSEHPTDEVLVAWLETGRPSRIERHLDGCPACLDRLDALSDVDEGTRAGMATVTAPPVDLAPRTARRVQGRVAAQEALSVFAELFVLPWRTLDALVDDTHLGTRVVPSGPPGGEDAHDDGERPDG